VCQTDHRSDVHRNLVLLDFGDDGFKGAVGAKACVVDQDVAGDATCRHPALQLCAASRQSKIGRDDGAAHPMLRCKSTRKLVERVFRPRHPHQMNTGRRQLLRDRGADARRGTGDQRGLSFQGVQAEYPI
jgi:hypothetical protein